MAHAPPVKPLPPAPDWPRVRVAVITTIDGQPHASEFHADANDPEVAAMLLRRVLNTSVGRHPTPIPKPPGV